VDCSTFSSNEQDKEKAYVTTIKSTVTQTLPREKQPISKGNYPKSFHSVQKSLTDVGFRPKKDTLSAMQAVSTPTLDISLFGSFQLHHSVHGEIKETRRKVQALLIWLLLEDNQAHRRA